MGEAWGLGHLALARRLLEERVEDDDEQQVEQHKVAHDHPEDEVEAKVPARAVHRLVHDVVPVVHRQDLEGRQHRLLEGVEVVVQPRRLARDRA
eukprot:2938861-Prymnesium_polylepis.1